MQYLARVIAVTVLGYLTIEPADIGVDFRWYLVDYRQGVLGVVLTPTVKFVGIWESNYKFPHKSLAERISVFSLLTETSTQHNDAVF